MEILGELAVVVLSFALAYTVGWIVFMLVRVGRLSLRGLAPAPDLRDPQGRLWSVRVGVAPPPLRYRVSSWLFQMRPRDRAKRRELKELDESAVDKDEIAHPSGMIEQFDEAVSIGVWLLLAFAVAALVVLLFEILLVAVLAGLVFLWRTLRSGWQVEVVAPDGRRHHVDAGSLGQAQAERDQLREEIVAGVYRIPPSADDDLSARGRGGEA